MNDFARMPRVFSAAGWMMAATLVALGKLAGPRRGEVLGPPTGRLADSLPPVAAVQDSGDGPRGEKAARKRRGPVRILAEIEAAFAASDSIARARRARSLLPRPLAELRMAASPLIMPRLKLPRVLTPDFQALRGLSARARPGEPVHVKLTAYCLRGATRRGTPTRPGVIAADPHIFPMTRHVELYAAGRHLGRFRVEDTGGAVRGPHIDIWTPDCGDAERFGTRTGVAALVGLGRD